MVLDDDVAGHEEALAGAHADGLGGEEGFEEPGADAFGDSGAVVLDADQGAVALEAGADDD